MSQPRMEWHESKVERVRGCGNHEGQHTMEITGVPYRGGSLISNSLVSCQSVQYLFINSTSPLTSKACRFDISI